MLAFSNDYYGIIFRATQSVELFCAYSGSALPARRDYKDTIFRRLFQDRENLLSLYNAVNRTSYTDAEALTVVTLENAVYMNMKNDVAFLLDNRLSLYEQIVSRFFRKIKIFPFGSR